jgi:hypothetical protein
VRIQPKDLPKTRRETLEWWACLEADCLSGLSPYTWKEIDRELSLCDLFYLLTHMLRRPDADRDWLHDRCREVQIDPNGMRHPNFLANLAVGS